MNKVLTWTNKLYGPIRYYSDAQRDAIIEQIALDLVEGSISQRYADELAYRMGEEKGLCRGYNR